MFTRILIVLLLMSARANAGDSVIAYQCTGAVHMASEQVAFCKDGSWVLPDQLPARSDETILLCTGDRDHSRLVFICDAGHDKYTGAYSLNDSVDPVKRFLKWLI